MKKSLFIGSFRGTKEHLKNFIESNVFSFEKNPFDKIRILRSYDYIMTELKCSGDEEKEICAIEIESDDLLSNIIRSLRKIVVKNKVTVCFANANADDESKYEFVKIHSNGKIEHEIEKIDLKEIC